MSDNRRDSKKEEEDEQDRTPKKLSSEGAAGESQDSSKPSDPNLKVTNLLLTHITFALLLLYRKEGETPPPQPH